MGDLLRHWREHRRQTFKLRHSAHVFKLTSFFVGQRDNNAITNATNELKGVPFLADDLVHVMLQRGNYVDRLVSRPQYTAMCSS